MVPGSRRIMSRILPHTRHGVGGHSLRLEDLAPLSIQRIVDMFSNHKSLKYILMRLDFNMRLYMGDHVGHRFAGQRWERAPSLV